MPFKFETKSFLTKNNVEFGLSDTINGIQVSTKTPVFYDNTTALNFSYGEFGKTTTRIFRYGYNNETMYTEKTKDILTTATPYNYLLTSTAGRYGRNLENINPILPSETISVRTDFLDTKFISDFNYKSVVCCLGVALAKIGNNYPELQFTNSDLYEFSTKNVVPLKTFYDDYLGGDYSKKISDIDYVTVENYKYFPYSLVIYFNSVGGTASTEEGAIRGETHYMGPNIFRLISNVERNITAGANEYYDWDFTGKYHGNPSISQTLAGVTIQGETTEGKRVECFASSYQWNFYIINERYTKKFDYNPNDYGVSSTIVSTFGYRVDLNYDECIRLGCTRGLPVCTTYNLADMNSYFLGQPTSNIYIPKINANGGCNGDYYTNQETAPQTEWTDNYYNNIDVSDDHNNYIEKIELNKPTLNQYEKFNTYYILTGNQLTQLQDYLWNADESIFNEIVKGLGLFGENPMNFILSLRQYPIKLNEISNTDNAEITIGRNIETGIIAKMVHNMNSVIDLGSCVFPKYFGDTFLSYSPYTNAKLYIPYCAEIDIPTADFVGHTINIKLAIDFITGACRGIVFCDDVIYTYTDGNIGETISVTGDNASDVANNYITGVTNTIGAVTSKNVIGTVSGVQNILNAGATDVKTAGTSSPNINLWLPQKCYFLVKMPQELLNDYTHYAHTTGFACDFYDDLIKIHGYTVCVDVDVNLVDSATDTEKTMLKNMLENGVYL